MSQANPSREWVRITQAENIPLREGRAVQIDGHDIAIFNLGDRFLAVENKCPHRGGPLADGIVSGSTVVCPLHAWKVDLISGEVRNHPEAPCTRTFATRVERGIILVEVDRKAISVMAASDATQNCFAQASKARLPNSSSANEVSC